MPIGPGARVGPYEVIALIGEGGMGRVYRATDTNLKRMVAIKVLPETVATDSDRLARFQREAEVLARLNHPNIAHIHGLERSDGTTALVMELVEGPTLADRIAQGPIPADEAIRIAKGIAEALEAAHDQNIIHRDLKPANIKVRPDGAVKVLDFGLAKAADASAANVGLVTQSPTLTSPALMTGVGVLLGTAAYMSPEQARGRTVDKRTDVWAFGAVVYEMLTGQRAFAGDDVSDVLASVLAREPDWTRVPSAVSPALVIFLKRCLAKDRRQRIRDIGDVSLALEGVFDDVAARTAPGNATPFWRKILPAVGAALIAVLLTGLTAWSLWPSPESRSATRFDHSLPEGQLPASPRPSIAISPDGRHFVYQSKEGLYLRAMDSLEARLIPGTAELLASPFFSPDGQWVGYFALPGQLKKVALGGGTPVIVSAVTMPFGASWTEDNTILFAQAAGIMRVSANGGTPELIVRAGAGEQIYGPQAVPDGVLFSVTKDQGLARWDQAEVVVQSLSSGRRTTIVRRGSDPRYLPTGHVVYALQGDLFAVTFDARRLTVAGGPVPLVQHVHRPVGVAGAGVNYAVSDNGTLIYVTAAVASRSLVWVDRHGTVEPIKSIAPGPHEDVRLSPDGNRVMLTRDGDIWIYDLASGRSNKVTQDGSSLMPVWDPMSPRVAYSSAKSGNLEAWVASTDGSSQPRQLTKLGGMVHVDSWSPDGQMLMFHHHRAKGPVPILMLPMDQADPKPQAFLDGDYSAEGASFSRDGRYVAFVSQQSGPSYEVYIRPFPGSGGQATVSVGGAQEPIWAKNGELFYRSLDGERMFAVKVDTEPALKVGNAVQLFEGKYFISPTRSPRPQYDVTPNGQRLLMLLSAADRNSAAARPRVVVVENWFEELKRLAPLRP